MTYTLVNDLPSGTEFANTGVDYRYRTAPKNKLIRFFPGPNPTLNTADTDYAGYVNTDYVVNNPGYVSNVFISFVGIYIGANGEYTGTYIANTQTEQYS